MSLACPIENVFLGSAPSNITVLNKSSLAIASNINPSRLGSKITKNECNQIIKNSKEITDLATNLGGTTIRSYTSSLGVYGSYQEHLKVHTKVNQKCQVCGTTILKTRVGGRGTYYCPKCQKY